MDCFPNFFFDFLCAYFNVLFLQVLYRSLPLSYDRNSGVTGVP